MTRLSVGIVGCGLMGRKRAAALGPDRAVAVCDADQDRAEVLAAESGARAVPDIDAVLAERPDVVVVATTHDALADAACFALAGGAHVMVEKPAGRTVEEVDRIAAAAAAARRRVKVGFNHRFHPGIMRAISEVRDGLHGAPMYMRARYGHGGRLGYDREWRAVPEISGGGELLDQGMHLLDLSHWLLGPLPLHSALLRTSYWDMPVEDNAVLTLADAGEGAVLDVPRELVGVEERVRAGHLHAHDQARGQRAGRLLRAPDPAHLAHAARDGAARAGGGRLPGGRPVVGGRVGPLPRRPPRSLRSAPAR